MNLLDLGKRIFQPAQQAANPILQKIQGGLQQAELARISFNRSGGFQQAFKPQTGTLATRGRPYVAPIIQGIHQQVNQSPLGGPARFTRSYSQGAQNNVVSGWKQIQSGKPNKLEMSDLTGALEIGYGLAGFIPGKVLYGNPIASRLKERGLTSLLETARTTKGTPFGGVNNLSNNFNQKLSNRFTGIGTEGLGIKGPAGMALDYALDPDIAPALAGKLTKGIKIRPKSNFSLDKSTYDELIEAEEMILNPSKFTKAESKEALIKIKDLGNETIERLSAKYLPNKQLNSLKTPQAKIKALVDLHAQNRLGNVTDEEFPVMGLTGNKPKPQSTVGGVGEMGLGKVKTGVETLRGGRFQGDKVPFLEQELTNFNPPKSLEKLSSTATNTTKNGFIAEAKNPIYKDALKFLKDNKISLDELYENSKYSNLKRQPAIKISGGVGEMGATTQPKLSPAIPKTGRTAAVSQSTLEPPTSQMASGNAIPQVGTQTKPNLSQVQSSDSILPQRKFAESVATNKKTPAELKPELDKIRYSPLSNKETLNYAEKMIKQSEAKALNYAKTGTDTNANAVALRLIEKYIDKGRYDEAIELTKIVSPRFTKQGQEIQILSAYGKLTPTGAIKYAQKVINEANKANPKLKLKLTEANTKTIVEAARKIQKLPEGSRERTVAIAQLMQQVTDLVPASIGQKVATIQTMMQLLNPKTAIRNIIGNTIFTGMENVSDVVATGMDNIVSLITGKRTKVLPSLKAQAGGFVKGGKEGLEDVKLGINTSPGHTKFDLSGKTFSKGPLAALEKALNIELRVPDRAAYTAAYDGSLNNQMRAARVTKPTEQMIEIAHADGLYRTFQDNSKLAQGFSRFKKVLNLAGTPDGKFGLGDFILKYPKTPANILARGLDYSPVGYVKSIYELARPLISGQAFNQKSFVETLSRATVGTGLIATGYLLAKNGIITGKQEKDYDINAVQKTTGQGAFKINVDALKRYWLSGGQPQDAQNGDTLVSYDWAQPTSLSLAMGANRALGGKFTDGINSAIESYQSAVDTITGQPMVRGLVDYAGGIKNKGIVGATTDAVLGSVAGFVPSLSRQTSNVFDQTQRNTYDPNKVTETTNKVKANIPWLRNTLQPKVDVFGREMPNYEGTGLRRLFDIFVNPAFVSKVQENPAAKEVLDIYQRSGETQQAPRVAPEKVKINGVDMQLTPQQYTTYQKYIGEKSNTLFNTIIADPVFKQSSDEDKAQLLANALSDINSSAKIELFGNQPKTTSGNVKWLTSGGQFGGVTLNEEGGLKLAPGSGGGTAGSYAVVNYNGTIKAIDTSRIESLPTPPAETGFAELDKEMRSTYKSELSSIVNDVRILYESGQITQEQAAAKMKEINDVYVGINAKGKKPKKLTIKKSPAPKTYKFKSPTLKVKALPKPKKTAMYKPKNIKISFANTKAKVKPIKITRGKA